MVIDILGLTLIVLFFIRGWIRGIIVALLSVLAVILGVICSLKLSGLLAQWMADKGWLNSGWALLVSYLLLFIGVILLVRLIGKALSKTAQLVMLGWLNGLVGGLLYAFMAAVVWSSLLWLANQMHLIPPEAKAYSRTYDYLEPLAPWVFEKAGKLLPFAKDIFQELTQYFSELNTSLPDHVGSDR